MCCAVPSRSVLSDSETPWTAGCQAPLSVGILQARILECVAMPSSKGSSQPRDWTQVCHIADRFFTSWATREALNHLIHVQISAVGQKLCFSKRFQSKILFGGLLISFSLKQFLKVSLPIMTLRLWKTIDQLFRRWSSLWLLDASSWLFIRPFATPWTVACQAPLSTEFSRPEYWSG